MDAFDESTFRKQVSELIATAPNRLDFVFKDGKHIETEWKDRSRGESWTDEMREAARQKQLERNGAKNEQ